MRRLWLVIILAPVGCSGDEVVLSCARKVRVDNSCVEMRRDESRARAVRELGTNGFAPWEMEQFLFYQCSDGHTVSAIRCLPNGHPQEFLLELDDSTGELVLIRPE